MRTLYILHNNATGNGVAVYEDLKMAKSIKKRMERTYGEIYSILQVEVVKELKD